MHRCARTEQPAAQQTAPGRKTQRAAADGNAVRPQHVDVPKPAEGMVFLQTAKRALNGKGGAADAPEPFAAGGRLPQLGKPDAVQYLAHGACAEGKQPV